MRQRPAAVGLFACLALLAAAGCRGDQSAGVSEAPVGTVDAGAIATAGPVGETPVGDALLTGQLTYRQRIALPKGALIVVSLVDLGDPGRVIAERRFVATSQVPIRFELPYESARLQGGRFYGVLARISVDGAPWFANDQPVPISALQHPDPVQVLLRPAVTAGR